jgi:hypothetical protein
VSASGGERRFRAQDARSDAPAKLDQTAALLGDLRVLGDDAGAIVGRGRAEFLGADGALLRHAADGILIKVQELCDRLPREYREARPDVPWAAIRGLRNRLGHNYRATDYVAVWNALERSLPELLAAIAR